MVQVCEKDQGELCKELHAGQKFSVDCDQPKRAPGAIDHDQSLFTTPDLLQYAPVSPKGFPPYLPVPV